jgi:hypothetical protein
MSSLVGDCIQETTDTTCGQNNLQEDKKKKTNAQMQLGVWAYRDVQLMEL